MKRELDIDHSKDDQMKSSEETCLWEKIAEKCYEKYNELISGGKPSKTEWTHLACFIRLDENERIDILSMGTGTKCLGGQIEERGTNGCLIHDSHAEIIARRSLIRLFYEEILSNCKTDLFLPTEDQTYLWNRKWKLIMFISSSPCGLASHRSNPRKKVKFEHKLLKCSSLNKEEIDELFLKPGKGSLTESLSCTNKIQRWIYQVKTIENEFVDGPSKDRVRPCPISLSWWKYLDNRSSISMVNGHILGQTRHLRDKHQYASPLSKISFFSLYLRLFNDEEHRQLTYAQAKSRSSNDLAEQFILKHSHWKRTDQNLFYSFRYFD